MPIAIAEVISKSSHFVVGRLVCFPCLCTVRMCLTLELDNSLSFFFLQFKKFLDAVSLTCVFKYTLIRQECCRMDSFLLKRLGGSNEYKGNIIFLVKLNHSFDGIAFIKSVSSYLQNHNSDFQFSNVQSMKVSTSHLSWNVNLLTHRVAVITEGLMCIITLPWKKAIEEFWEWR